MGLRSHGATYRHRRTEICFKAENLGSSLIVRSRHVSEVEGLYAQYCIDQHHSSEQSRNL
jgi:hypothetical protein